MTEPRPVRVLRGHRSVGHQTTNAEPTILDALDGGAWCETARQGDMLVPETRRGDEQKAGVPMIAHEEFVAALVTQLPGLRRYAVALVGNAALADDLVQDSIERALRQSSQLRELQKLSGWLRRILHNLYIDEVRRGGGRTKHQDITELADHLELSVPASNNAGIRDFVRAMNALSPEHRQILFLVGVEEMNYREIADELDIPMGTVMSRLARARERLRKIMEEGPAEVVPLQPRQKDRT